MHSLGDFSPRDFGARLEAVRGHRSQEAFAQGLGVHKNTLRLYERGQRMPDAAWVALLCQREDLLPEWLLFGAPPRTVQERRDTERLTVRYAAADQLQEDFILVPRYESPYLIREGALVPGEQVESQVAFRKSWVLGDMRLNPDRLAAILVVGDAMEPTLRHQDILLLDLAQNSLQQDALYALNFDGHLGVKRLQMLPDGGLLIHSDHPAYRGVTLSKAEREALHIVGRVVWMGRRL